MSDEYTETNDPEYIQNMQDLQDLDFHMAGELWKEEYTMDDYFNGIPI